MDAYARTDDIAYGDRRLRALDTETRELFERTLSAVGVPPSMRARARLNLLLKLEEGGVAGIEAILARAVEARAAVTSYLEKSSRRP